MTEAGDYVDHGNDQLLSYGAIDEVPVSPMNAKDLEAYGFATPRSPISPKQPVSLSKWNAYKVRTMSMYTPLSTLSTYI